ncbi:uncharacterized protein LOC114828034 [Galendromus occidentalis]|uniref:Uncharacterized protein LOC114828034 n=1 Tax=Galendromus occidentalis TaxID=34638 RepID=A0AAJ7WGP7_9ACAR|nr:uncharacterized protein LOC114828034 [Galendromus occidentalis]
MGDPGSPDRPPPRPNNQPQITVKENDTTTGSPENPDNYLPKLSKNFTLPRFNGDTKQYRGFMDTFDAFVHVRSIPKLQKIILLEDALSGRALNAVRHLNLRAENYEPMKALLEEEFGRTNCAVDAHIHEMERILSTGGEITLDKLPNVVNLVTNNTQRKFLETSSPLPHSTDYLEVLIRFMKAEARRTGELRAKQGSARKQFSNTPIAKSNHQAQSRPSPSGTYRPRNPFYRGKPNQEGSESLSYKNPSNSFHINSTTSRIPSCPVPNTPKPSQATPCFFCQADHPPYKCTAQLTHQERMERVAAAGACLRCLKLNHLAKNCKEGPKTSCRFCNSTHCAIICSKAPIQQNLPPTKHTSVNLNNDPDEEQVYLWTAHVIADETKTQSHICRILIDPGSESSNITEAMSRKLNSFPSSRVKKTMSTAGGQVSNIHNCGIHDFILRSRFDPEKILQLKAIELKCISRSKFPIMNQNFGLHPAADQVGDKGTEWVDILLGAKNLSKLGFTNPKSFGNIFALESIFGWVFGGSAGSSRMHSPLNRFCGFVSAQPCTPRAQSKQSGTPASNPSPDKTDDPSGNRQSTKDDIDCLWLSEDLRLEDDPSNEQTEGEDALNKALIEHFEKTTTRDRSGRYILRLPFRDNIHALGDNENLARYRLFSFLKKLKDDPVKLRAVDEEIRAYIDAGFAEKAEPREDGQLAHYLPIQAVFKHNPDTPSGLKTRVVKDASARRSIEAGLNDVLHQGPNLLPNLIKVIMKLRRRIAHSCDSSGPSAYHQTAWPGLKNSGRPGWTSV